MFDRAAKGTTYGVFVRFRKSRLPLRRGIVRLEEALTIAATLRRERLHGRDDVFVVREPDGAVIDGPGAEEPARAPEPKAVAAAATEPGDDETASGSIPRASAGPEPSAPAALAPVSSAATEDEPAAEAAPTVPTPTSGAAHADRGEGARDLAVTNGTANGGDHGDADGFANGSTHGIANGAAHGLSNGMAGHGAGGGHAPAGPRPTPVPPRGGPARPAALVTLALGLEHARRTAARAAAAHVRFERSLAAIEAALGRDGEPPPALVRHHAQVVASRALVAKAAASFDRATALAEARIRAACDGSPRELPARSTIRPSHA
ncbi:MAG: hypothetical protein QM820_05075 [Minicystis sp.]